MDFLPHKGSKKLKTYVEKFSGLFLKGKLRLYQWTEYTEAEIMIPFTNAEISSLLGENGH